MFGFDKTAIKIVTTILVILVVFGYGYYRGHNAVSLQFSQYKTEMAVAAQQQAKETAKIEFKNKQLFEETKYAYDTKLTALRNYYSMRITQSGSTLSGLPNTTTRSVGHTPDNLPPITTLAAECAETTLTLRSLQNWVKDVKANAQ